MHEHVILQTSARDTKTVRCSVRCDSVRLLAQCYASMSCELWVTGPCRSVSNTMITDIP